MTEQRIDLNMLSRIDSEQKATASRVEAVDKNLQSLAREVSGLTGSIKAPAETPWWIRFIVAPLCVAAAIATVGVVIRLMVQVNGIETFVRENGGAIAGLRLGNGNPSDPQTAKEAEQILAQAKKAKIKIPEQVIADTGQRFIFASAGSPSAWAPVLSFLDYRTFLNADSLPPIGESTPVNPNYKGVSTVTDLRGNKGETVIAYSVWFKNVCTARQIGSHGVPL